jgi:hypothetical protein
MQRRTRKMEPNENISTPNLSYAAQYLACALPCERFTSALADIPCITRGRCGSLLLHRNGLPPSAFCRSPGAPVHSIKNGQRMISATTFTHRIVVCTRSTRRQSPDLSPVGALRCSRTSTSDINRHCATGTPPRGGCNEHFAQARRRIRTGMSPIFPINECLS